MAPKKKAGDGAKRGKSAKKTKAPEFITDEADCLAFGLRYQDIVRTPLGLTGKVLGVKYDDATKTAGRLWVEYSNGMKAPLEPKNTNVIALGYKRAADADHIWRDIASVRARVRAAEEQRAAADAMRLRMEALALEGDKKKKKAPAPARPQTAL